MSDLLSRLVDNQVVGTVIVIVVAFAIRFFVQSYLMRRDDIAPDQRRRIVSAVRNALFFAVLVGLALVWAPSLRTFALSLTAFVVAIILATKELILCISGSFVKTTSGSMRIGNWIEVNGLRGEVVDQTLMTTTIQELGKNHEAYEYSGRTIVLPNSIFLTAPVINERFHKRYVFHSFQLVADAQTDFVAVEQAMVSTINAAMADEQDVAKRYLSLIEKRSGFNIHDPEPRARIEFLNDARVKIVMTAFLPTKRAMEIEQQAIKRGLAELQAQKALPSS